MAANTTWTTEAAMGDFVRVLKQARDLGPQEIKDETGTYVLRVVDDFSKDDAARILLKRRPEGNK